MYKCLCCGKTSRAKHPTTCRTPGCYGVTVSVCDITATLAKQFYLMGYRLSFTEAYTSHVVAAEKERDVAPNGWKVVTACVEFSHRYPPEVFSPGLPGGWEYWADLDIDEDYCRLVYFDLGADKPMSKSEISRELRSVVQELTNWAITHSKSDVHAIHCFAGLLG